MGINIFFQVMKQEKIKELTQLAKYFSIPSYPTKIYQDKDREDLMKEKSSAYNAKRVME